MLKLTTGGVNEIHDSSFLKKLGIMYKRLEKHNIIDIVRRNELLEFKKQDLIKLCEYSSYRDYYSTYNIENLLQELVSEGKLEVYYISVKVEPLKYNYGYPIIDYKVGSKSVAVYKLNRI